MQELKEEIQALSMKISAVTDFFYQQKEAEAYQGMELILLSVESVTGQLFQYKQKHPEAPFDQSQLILVLTEAMRAMEARDNVLLADTLEYELKELLLEIEAGL